MLKSMTAYGRGIFDLHGAHFVVEIQSVNRRHLEIQVGMPDYLASLESEIRREVAQAIARGQISVKIRITYKEKTPFVLTPNLALAKELKAAWHEISESIGVDGFKLSFLKDIPELMSLETEESFNVELQNGVKHALQKALEALRVVKLNEGAYLTEDLLMRLAILKEKVEAINNLSHLAPAKWRKKLIERIQDVIQHAEVDDRIHREVALYAEKMDITEECVRFKSHLAHAHEVMKNKDTAGKALEFILQELGREINTMGSKSQDIEVTRLVIESKGEIEKIREQVQNVE